MQKCMGRRQFVVLRNEALVLWLAWALKGLDVLFWPGGRTTFLKHWEITLSSLHLDGLRLTPGSLRAGGATELCLRNEAIGTTKFKGRWAAESSLNVYIQEAMSTMVMLRVRPITHTLLAQLRASGNFALKVPPSIPWHYLFSRYRQWQRKRKSLMKCRQPLSRILGM